MAKSNAERCREYYASNKEALLAQKREYYQNNREAIKAKNRAHYARVREREIARRRLWSPAKNEAKRAAARAWYARRSMTALEVREALMGRKRPDACEICGRGGRIVFDHCHATGAPRGWLCDRCNTTLGALEDSSQLLEQMGEYLKRHEALRTAPPE